MSWSEFLKTLDMVWHKSLISKFPSYGFPLFLSKLIPSFLSNRSIAVILHGSASLFLSLLFYQN